MNEYSLRALKIPKALRSSPIGLVFLYDYKKEGLRIPSIGRQIDIKWVLREVR